MDSALAAATAAVAFPNFADVAGAVALLFLADSSPAPSPPPPPPTVRYFTLQHSRFSIRCSARRIHRLPVHCSDELSCYSGSSASYSGTSAKSCVSDSAQHGRPVDPLRVLAVVASLRRIDPKVLAKATNTLFQGESSKKRKGVWIHIDDDEDESERNSAVASEGSTVTGTASAGSTATSGRSHRPPRVSGGGDQLPRRADTIMKWLSRPGALPATETTIRAAVGDNAGTSKALRLLLKRGCLRRTGTGGRSDPYVYMVCETYANCLN
uniref:HTH three-helical bundle domain-containing protein n=1 Tax=Oryza punctata TaxID=4537 RepID=A0A0E0LP85_ORYPU